MNFNREFDQRQRGVSLIEALVGTLILGVAVLGYAGLEVTGLKMTNEAFLRERATSLAVDAKERMRMNRAEKDFYLDGTNWVTGAASCNSSGVACTASEVAVHDVSELITLAADYLPGGSVGVRSCGTANTAENCIIVSWAVTTTASCDPSTAYGHANFESQTNCVEVVVYDF